MAIQVSIEKGGAKRDCAEKGGGEKGGGEKGGADPCGKTRRTESWAVAAIYLLKDLTGWIRARLRRGRELAGRRKQMQLVESLALGNRRQLLLVVCGGQRYLVGAGVDCVGSILAIEQGPLTMDDAGPADGISPGVKSGAGKGPELVRHRVRRTSPAPKRGADRWQ